MVHMDSINEEFTNNSEDFVTARDDIDDIILHPFAHQVGGHTQLLTWDKSTLCKPLIPRELLFYLNVPRELVKFVPSYKGVVQIRETGQGIYPPVLYQPLRSPKSPYAKIGQGTSCTLPANFPFELKVQIRPCFDEKILKKNLSQENLLRADYISRPNEKYLLLLENVASKYKLPCILDLKMGTRQHGDDATEEKRHRQIAKCQASTSASLGVRLCGMQVYQVDYDCFLWYDKYYGRKMDEDGLKKALHQYFRNGSQLNEDIIDDVINRLKLLSDAVEKSPSFRFYGTSLLIIHEGCTSLSTKKCPVDVRLIDFAHTICDYSNTNGRSSSSPSVLRSSSAEQLSQPKSPPPTSLVVQKSNDDGVDEIQLQNQDLENHHPQIVTKQSLNQQPQRQAPEIVETLISNNSSSSSGCENNSSSSISGGINNMINNNDNNNNVNNNNNNSTSNTTNENGFNIFRSTTKQDSVETLRELVDISSTTSPAKTINRQINSTPTTPPSLGNRKISKTSMGPDRGLLFGLENLMRLLDDLKSETLVTC